MSGLDVKIASEGLLGSLVGLKVIRKACMFQIGYLIGGGQGIDFYVTANQ